MNGRLIVGAPDQFAVQWNETKHARCCRGWPSRLLGAPTSASSSGSTRSGRSGPRWTSSSRRSPSAAVPSAAERSNPSAQPLNERYTFDTFVIGKSNELAAAAAHAVAEAPGQDLQPALHLRRHRARQDPPDAGHRPRRLQRQPRDPGALRRRRAVHQRGHREHPQPHHAGVPAPLPRPTSTSSWWTTCTSSKARKRPRKSSSTPSTRSTRATSRSS